MWPLSNDSAYLSRQQVSRKFTGTGNETVYSQNRQTRENIFVLIAFHFHRFNVYVENFLSLCSIAFVCMLMTGLRLSNLNKETTYLLTYLITYLLTMTDRQNI